MKKHAAILMMMVMGFLSLGQDQKPKVETLENGLTQATFYHENGKIAQQGTFLDGKRHGEWISYDADGNKTAVAQYTQDKKSGKWFIWKGDLLTEVDYENNTIANVNKWVSKEAVVSNRP